MVGWGKDAWVVAYRILATFMIIIKVKVHCTRLRLTLSNSENRGDGRQQVITNIKHWRMSDKGWNKMRKKCYIDILNKL